MTGLKPRAPGSRIPLGLHGGVWPVAASVLATLAVSRFTEAPSAATVRRVPGEVERLVYGPR